MLKKLSLVLLSFVFVSITTALPAMAAITTVDVFEGTYTYTDTNTGTSYIRGDVTFDVYSDAYNADTLNCHFHFRSSVHREWDSATFTLSAASFTYGESHDYITEGFVELFCDGVKLTEGSVVGMDWALNSFSAGVNFISAASVTGIDVSHETFPGGDWVVFNVNVVGENYYPTCTFEATFADGFVDTYPLVPSTSLTVPAAYQGQPADFVLVCDSVAVSAVFGGNSFPYAGVAWLVRDVSGNPGGGSTGGQHGDNSSTAPTYQYQHGLMCDLGTAKVFWTSDGGISVYRASSPGSAALVVNLEELPDMSIVPTVNTLIEETTDGGLYAGAFQLTTNEYQVNVGPDADGKVYECIWDPNRPENAYRHEFWTNK